MTNFTTARTLEQLKNYGGSCQRIHKADQVLDELKTMLLDAEYQQVRIAVDHYRHCGEGRVELDQVCNRLIRQYTGFPPELKNRRLL